METTITVFDEGEEITHTVPCEFVVCPRCHGEGKHVNPAIDGNGITQSEMDELGQDFLDDYMGGGYDVTCSECGGKRVGPEIDWSKVDPALVEAYERQQREEDEYQQTCAMERAMGA